MNQTFLSKQKLLEEIEKNKERVDECQKYATAYIDTIKVSMKQLRCAYRIVTIGIHTIQCKSFTITDVWRYLSLFW